MFFFFKQKTAYEMRISDWSSDVCSSDLLGTVGTHAINQSVYKEMSFDAVKDFAPISLVAAVPNILVANPSLEANSVDRKSVVEGKSVSVRVDLGGSSIIKKKNKDTRVSTRAH